MPLPSNRVQGVAYEKLLKGPTSPPPNGEIMWNVSILGARPPLSLLESLRPLLRLARACGLQACGQPTSMMCSRGRCDFGGKSIVRVAIRSCPAVPLDSQHCSHQLALHSLTPPHCTLSLHPTALSHATQPHPHSHLQPPAGFLASAAYQVLYTLPNWDRLVGRHLAAAAAAGRPPTYVAGLLAVFGGLFNLHMLVQAAVFKSEGAIGVGLVNAVRGAAITLVVAALFCDTDRQHLCLTRQTLASAAVTTVGGAIYVLAGGQRRPPAKPRVAAAEAGPAQPAAAAAATAAEQEGEAAADARSVRKDKDA